MHIDAGQVETSDSILELKVHLYPALTCSEFLVSCSAMHIRQALARGTDNGRESIIGIPNALID